MESGSDFIDYIQFEDVDVEQTQQNSLADKGKGMIHYTLTLISQIYFNFK